MNLTPRALVDTLENVTYGRQSHAPPPNVYILIPQTCEGVTLHNKGTTTEQVKLRTLSWREAGGSVSENGDVAKAEAAHQFMMC